MAAAYRLVAAYGWSDLVFTHISARIPGPAHGFLIDPVGLFRQDHRAQPTQWSSTRTATSCVGCRSRSTRPTSRSTAAMTRRATTPASFCTPTAARAYASACKKRVGCRWLPLNQQSTLVLVHAGAQCAGVPRLCGDCSAGRRKAAPAQTGTVTMRIGFARRGLWSQPDFHRKLFRSSFSECPQPIHRYPPLHLQSEIASATAVPSRP